MGEGARREGGEVGEGEEKVGRWEREKRKESEEREGRERRMYFHEMKR